MAGREPSATKWVPLCEALTWIAFRNAMSIEELRNAVEGDRPVSGESPEERLRGFFRGDKTYQPEAPGTGHFANRETGLQHLADAWQKLRDGVDSKTIMVRGRHTANYSLADAKLADAPVMTGSILATFSQFDVSTGGMRRKPEGTPRILWRDHPQSFERELESFVGDERSADGYLIVEGWRHELLSLFPAHSPAPIDRHQHTVNWCRSWIVEGKGTGMDLAWDAFKVEPGHAGLSRDNVFRPAWKEAKAGN